MSSDDFRTASRTDILELVRSIDPLDDVEREHIADALAWIASGEPLCRIAKPDHPPRHLVSYFAAVDVERGRVLLVDHINAGLWLPNGGHVEPDEHPAETVRRECLEELRVDAVFVVDRPMFMSVADTVGSTAGHTDVSLWYVVHGDSSEVPWFDSAECSAVRWFAIEDLPHDRTDPHLARFVRKLRDVVGI